MYLGNGICTVAGIAHTAGTIGHVPVPGSVRIVVVLSKTPQYTGKGNLGE